MQIKCTVKYYCILVRILRERGRKEGRKEDLTIASATQVVKQLVFSYIAGDNEK